MIMMDPHKAVMSIMKKRNEKTASAPIVPEHTKDTDGELDPRHMAAEDVMSAFHSKNTQHLLEALGNFHDMHMMHREREEQESPRDEEDLSMESDRPEL